MKVRPIRDVVAVRRGDKEKVSAGGIVIPDVVENKDHRGIVVAVGPGRRTKDGVLIPMELKEGDRVIWQRHFGAWTGIDGTDYAFLSEDEILAVLED